MIACWLCKWQKRNGYFFAARREGSEGVTRVMLKSGGDRMLVTRLAPKRAGHRSDGRLAGEVLKNGVVTLWGGRHLGRSVAVR